MMKVRLDLIVWVLISIALSEQSSSADDGDIIKPNLVKPGWKSKYHRLAEVPTDLETCRCPPVSKFIAGLTTKQTETEEENNRLAFISYRKFLIRLFDENKLEVDEEKAAFKLRNVQLKITNEQLRKLKEAPTAREMDSVAASIFEQSGNSVYRSMGDTLCWNIFSWYGSAMQSSVFLYVIVPAVVILFGLWMGSLWGIRLWVLMPVLGILITYVLTYRDCNYQLELESLAKLMKTDGSNPCAKLHESRWFSWFRKDNEAACIEQLRQQYGMKKTFCDPSEVFVQMVATLNMQYFETFVMKMVSIFHKSTASSNFVEKGLINGFILSVVCIMIKYGLKYFMYASGRLMTDVITRTTGQAAVQGDAQQEPAQLPPTAPFHLSININQPELRVNYQLEPIANRIEEVTEVEPNVAGALASAAPVDETSWPNEDGSSIGPAVRNETTDESEFTECDQAVDVRKDDPIVYVR